jgi:hypothetical protein
VAANIVYSRIIEGVRAGAEPSGEGPLGRIAGEGQDIVVHAASIAQVRIAFQAGCVRQIKTVPADEDVLVFVRPRGEHQTAVQVVKDIAGNFQPARKTAPG